MRIKVVFVIVLFGIFDTTWAQFVWDTVPSDTLQFSPMIYCYNCPDTSVYHDSIECTFYETNGSMTGNDYPTWYGHYLTEFALYQHTDRPLKVVGIAFSAVRGNYAELRLYDSVMNLIASDTMLSWECWDMDPSRYDVFVLPGKTTTDMEFPLTEKIELQLLYFSNINEGITLTGGFWIGISRYSESGPNGSKDPTYIYEHHEAPYRINNVRYMVLENGVWREDTVEGSLPELFLIVEPQCQDVAGLTAVMDSLGNVDVRWDSVDNQNLWVVEMHGPGVSVMDTVSTNHWHYTGLYPSMAYAVKVKARCFKEKYNIWSNWTGTLRFGNTDVIDAVEYEPLTVTLKPNPAKDKVTIAAEGFDGTATVSVMTVGGLEVLRCERTVLPLTLDLAGLASGIYMVRVSTPTGTATKRLVVQ